LDAVNEDFRSFSRLSLVFSIDMILCLIITDAVPIILVPFFAMSPAHQSPASFVASLLTAVVLLTLFLVMLHVA
jgi:hypothetical protein